MKKTILNIGASILLCSSLYADATDKIYVVVNGEKITSKTISIALKNPDAKFETLPKETQKDILSKLVEQKLLSQKALTTDVVNDTIYKETLQNVKQDLALQVWMQRISKKIKVSKDQINKFYSENKKLFQMPAQLKARHILVHDEKTALDIISKLKNTHNLKNKFISLAKEKSTGPSGKNGGDLGWFSKKQMVPEFSNAASKLKIGAITTKPVKTQFGYHIIYLEDKKNKATATLSEALPQIKQELNRKLFIEKVQEVVTKLKQKATIVYK